MRRGARARGAEVERRISGTVELRENPTGGPTLVGYAAVFGALSDDLGGFREIIEPGAFTKTLGEADVRALMNHDPNYVLGRTKSGTLRLAEDERGLAFEVDAPDTQWARDLVVTMRRQDINQCSFAFRPVRWTWEIDEATESRIWRQQEVALYDVSPAVTFPAYPQTSSAVRSLLAGLSPGELPERGRFDNVFTYSPNGYRFTDPDVAFATCLVDHYADLLEAAAVVPGQVDRPELLALAAEIRASTPALIQRCSDILELIAAEDDGAAAAPPAADRASTPPQRGHLLDLLDRSLDLIA